MQDVGGKMQSAGSEITQSFGMAFLAVGAGLGLTAKKAMDFESQMSSVKSVMSPDEVNEFGASLTDLAKKMGAETKFSSLEAAQGIEELIKAGVTVTDIINGGLDGALSLAVAGELELADAAEVASTALNAFKKDNLSVMQAADLLAGAANASATSVSEMKFGLSMVSAVASGVGLSFKDTTTALASFAQNGLTFSPVVRKLAA
ncbi:phage tail tape measure protein [Bacillus sp. T33-2]|nr:phage tail tape measure protein [Bacillus sp. T33-2]